MPSSLTKLANIPLPTTWNDQGEGFVYVQADLDRVSSCFVFTDGLNLMPSLWARKDCALNQI